MSAVTASVFCATSLDGFIARADGGIDWLPASSDVEPHGFTEFFASVDAMVIGRGTLETVLGFGGWGYGKKPVVVLSRSMSTLTVPKEAVCELMAGDPHDIVRRLAERGYHHVYVDGGITIQGFLEADLIDRMIVTRVPILIGSGIPLFGALSHDVRWQHVRTNTYRPGLVQSEYVREKN
jgi:dihydrofolate reductase